MPASLMRLIAAALLLALIQSAANHGAARVIHDSGAVSANPAVEKGGVHLKTNPEPAIPYSLVGAIASEGRWFMQCALAPFERLGWRRPHRDTPAGAASTHPGPAAPNPLAVLPIRE